MSNYKRPMNRATTNCWSLITYRFGISMGYTGIRRGVLPRQWVGEPNPYQVTLAQKIAKKPVIERKMSLRGSSRCGFKRHSGNGKRGKMPRLREEHAAHCAPLERGNLDISHSIHMSIRWIEEFDADKS